MYKYMDHYTYIRSAVQRWNYIDGPSAAAGIPLSDLALIPLAALLRVH